MTDLKDARVLVTGGAGLVGSHLIDGLVGDEGVREVVVLDDFSRGTSQNLDPAMAAAGDRITVIKGDIRDRSTVADAMAGIDVVFHQAAIRITQCAEDPRLAVEVLVDGSYNVYEAAIDAGVRKVVSASSASVYGQAEELPTTERHHPWNNDTIYGAAKVFNEGMLRSFHRTRGLDYVALRYFNVYGPRMDIFGVYTEVLVRWMERIEAGQPPLIHGDGSQTMDFVFITDIARANLCAAKADVTDEVYNVGTGTQTSLLQLAQALSKVMGSDLGVEHGEDRKLVSVQDRKADVSKATRDLGFTATVDLEAGLTRLVDWWRAAKAAS
jgi:nucleoside-diphosphate-sugar epimerase